MNAWALPPAEEYASFLAAKHCTVPDSGFFVDSSAINHALFPFQRDIVQWALRRGRAAIFSECGTGKTPMQLEWSRHVVARTGRPVLVLAPLAVTQQTAREGAKFGIPVTVARAASDMRPGVNVTNYELLERFDPGMLGGVVLDESSILKSYMGQTKQRLITAFAQTPYRLCCTATPAPNDHMEIGNHAEFLGVMRSGEMLMRWFINDTMKMGTYRLKGHAERDFWEWVASWGVSLRRPSDLGYSNDGYDVPPLHLHQRVVPVDRTAGEHDGLFRLPAMSATDMHRELRLTAADRAAAVAELVNDSDEPWIVWCTTNYEADELTRRIPDAIEVRGNESIAAKERKLEAFGAGDARVMVSKPSVCGFGLNWQHCHHVAFVGLSYSFEQFYQALRRTYRYGQLHPVEAHVITADTEDVLVSTLQRKIEAHERLMDAMNSASRTLRLDRRRTLQATSSIERHAGPGYELLQGDCVAAVREMPEASVHFSIFSPPFSQLYTYSDRIEDMGNSADDAEFFQHLGYLIPELYRVTVPGRLCAVHCKQLVNYKGRDGKAGLRDFRGDLIRAFLDHDWAYHSEVCIWKDPVIEMQRTKAHGLLYKQLRADSSFSRQGMAEYLLLFRRWPDGEIEESQVEPVTHTKEEFPLEVWQRYASPIWMDIRQTNVLNVQAAREDRDEKHICPLQLDVIERAIDLWSNPGDLVLDPFSGLGSTGYVAVPRGRRYVGVELKESYHRQAIANLHDAVQKGRALTLFDTEEAS